MTRRRPRCWPSSCSSSRSRAFYAQRFWLGRKSYTTVAGKGDAGVHPPLPRPMEIGITAIAVFWLLLTVIVYATIVYGSFVKLWGVDTSLTLDHYKQAFAIGWNEFGLHWKGSAWSSFWTTLWISRWSRRSLRR